MKMDNGIIQGAFGAGGSAASDVDQALRISAVRNMAEQERSALVAGLFGVVAIGCAALFRDHGLWLMPALALRLFCMAHIYMICVRIMALVDAGRPHRGELRRFERAMIINGLSWGIVLWPVGGVFVTSMPALVIILSALVSMALLVLAIAIERRSMVCALGAFAVSFLAPLILSIQSLGLLPLVGSIGFVFAVGIYGSRHGERVRSALRVRIENQQLAQALGEANSRLSDALAAAERLAEEDSLTGLLNRRAFEKRAGDLLLSAGKGRHVYLMLADIDRFKAINDNFGHAIGDVVLELTSEVMMETCGKNAICGRWGGEEFLIAVAVPDRACAERIVRSLKDGIKAVSYRLGIDGISVSASFGLSHWQPNEDMDAAVARADRAMYLAKGERRRSRLLAG